MVILNVVVPNTNIVKYDNNFRRLRFNRPIDIYNVVFLNQYV